MKKVFTYVRNIIIGLALLYVTSLMVDIRVEGVPVNTIYENVAKDTYNFIEDIIKQLRNTPEVSDFKISKNTDGQYELNVTVKNVDVEEIESITINDTLYTDFLASQDGANTIIKVTLDITFDPGVANIIYTVNQVVYVRNGESVTLDTSFAATAFKSIDTAIVDLKEQSVVAITACVVTGPFTQCNTLGSGLLFDMQPNPTYSNLYDYYILTNSHVVNGADTYEIYYNNYKINTHAELMGTYTNNTDLAILKLSISVSTLVVLQDDQFDTREIVPVYKGQIVFSIGTPYELTNFNTIEEGVVTALNVNIVLSDEETLCQTGCQAFQTDAALGPGSSGGAMFDSAGNLIGIHFAGNDTNTISSEIPMSKVFEAIDAILG